MEHILCAAIWVDTGKAEPPRRSYTYPKTGLMFTGWRHSDCFTTLNAWKDLLDNHAREEMEEQLAGKIQGFMTSIGRFVTREEAATIAHIAKQTKKLLSGLTSEDLY